MQDQLHDVQQIQATESALAAILGDGCVVTWGDADYMLATAVRCRTS